jgi:RNA polymerase sigma-70 factor (ECF subfamily)
MGSASIHGLVQAEDEVVETTAGAVVAVSFDEFFAEHHDRLYRALFFITGNSHDADELCQDAFLKLWERWDRIGTIDDPVGYLFRVALNGFRMRLRRAKTAARRALFSHDLPRDAFDEIEVREDVHSMLRSLPARQRAAVVLTEIYGYGSEEAGRIMHIAPSTVRVLASQGRGALRGARGDTHD